MIISSGFLGFVSGLGFCSLFSLIEIQVTALRLSKLKKFSRGTTRYHSFIHVLEQNPQRILMSILIAQTISIFLAAVLGNQFMEYLILSFNIPSRLGKGITLLIVPVIILLAIIIPKKTKFIPEDKLFKLAFTVSNIVYYAFSPLVTLLLSIIAFIKRLMGSKDEEAADDKELMEGYKGAVLEKILQLKAVPIKDIMIPESSVISINANSTQKETLDLFSKYQFTRLPVYKEESNTIIGVLYQNDFFQLLSKKEDRPLREIIRPVTFVPEKTKALTMLKNFRKQHNHIAIVVDEQGNNTGLITLADIIEEIVGKIATNESENA